MHVLVVGCGYLGRRAADRWLACGHQVSALTRSPQRAAEWSQLGIRAIVGDVLDPTTLRKLPPSDLCLFSVGFDRTQSASKFEVYVHGLRNVCDALEGRCSKLIYISSSSVYGQSDGSWVNEDSPTQPTSEGGGICLQAERWIHEAVYTSRLPMAVILRLAGIYGPGRLLARRDQLLAGCVLPGNPEAWLNLIHVDDAATAILILGEAEREGLVTYLLSDHQPVLRSEFYNYLASLYSAPPPRFDEQDSTYNKRCDSARIRCELNLTLRYPTYRDGLQLAGAGG